MLIGRAQAPLAGAAWEDCGHGPRAEAGSFFLFFGEKESLLYFGCWQPEEGWVREIRLSRGWLPRTDNQWQQLLKTERGLHAETAQSALIVILKSVISDLAGVVVVALGVVNLLFQGQFVSTPLRPILELWQLILWVQPGHPAVNFSTWFLLSIRQLTGCGSEYYL